MENAGAEEANANDSATTDVGLLRRACGDQPSSSLTAGLLDFVLRFKSGERHLKHQNFFYEVLRI
jgi:hypothetical protein